VEQRFACRGGCSGGAGFQPGVGGRQIGRCFGGWCDGSEAELDGVLAEDSLPSGVVVAPEPAEGLAAVERLAEAGGGETVL
jgi:hypothetical protein